MITKIGIYLLIGFTYMALNNPVYASGGNGKKFGIGIVVGEPTGISFKWWTGEDRALDFNLSWGWGWDRWHPYDQAYHDERCYNPDYFRRNIDYCERQEYFPNDPDWYTRSRFHFHTDYLFHNFDVFETRETFALYYGPGAGFTSWRSTGYISARGIIGISWIGKSTPLDVFIELAPELVLFPYWLGVNPTGGMGVRFYL